MAHRRHSGTATLAAALLVMATLLTSLGLIAEAAPKREAARIRPAGSATATRDVPYTPTPVPTPEERECVGYGNKTASGTAFLDGRVRITMTFEAYCRSGVTPLHLGFILDGSETMAGQKSRDMKSGVTDLIENLKLEDNPRTKVAVIEFQNRAYSRCRLSNDGLRAQSCVRRVKSEGEAAIDLGIHEAVKELIRGRRDYVYDIHEALVLVSDGRNEAGCAPILLAARQAKMQSALVITVCVGEDCDDQCLRQAASSPRYHYDIAHIGALAGVFEGNELHSPHLKQLTVTDVLPDNMSYVAGSAEPEPTDVSLGGNRVTWITYFVPWDGVTLTLEVEPRELGRHPTNVGAKAIYKDPWNNVREFTYPVPYVEVVSRPTSTNTATASTASATATSSPSPTPQWAQTYLPIAHCGEHR